MSLRWLRDKLSRAIGWVRAQIKSPARLVETLLPGAAGWLRAQIKSPVHLIKSLFMATIGKDRGFGFWWLVAMVAIALAIGLLVTVLLSPVLGILAALIVGIWMLVSRSRSSQSLKTNSGSATDSASPAATGS